TRRDVAVADHRLHLAGEVRAGPCELRVVPRPSDRARGQVSQPLAATPRLHRGVGGLLAQVGLSASPRRRQPTRLRATDRLGSRLGLKIVMLMPTARPLATAARSTAASSSKSSPSVMR